MQTWSTEAVAPHERLDYWVGAICEAFLEMSCDSRNDQPFAGKLMHLQADAISFTQVIAAPAEVSRTRQAIARSKESPFYLICDLANTWHASQGDLQLTMHAGDLLLIDSAQSYHFNFPSASNNISVQMPRHWLAQWAEPSALDSPHRIDGRGGWGAPLSALCQQIGREPAAAHDLPPRVLSDQVGAMLAASLGTNVPSAQASTGALVQQALDLMHQRLAEATLNADVIAGALNVSTRSLFRYFSAEKTTFNSSLLKLRMLHATELLAQPRLARITVEALGRRCGYAEPSNFVRQFHRYFGQTPAKWRKERN